jgi:biuret amidohydrolase
VAAELTPGPNELVVNKTSRSAFSSTGIDQLLRNMGLSQVLVTGLASNGCVDLTAKDAADRGYETFLLEDACATFGEEAHTPVLQAFQEVFGTVLSTDEVMQRVRTLNS